MIHRSQIKLSHHNKTLQEEENTSCWMSKTRHYTLRYKLLRPWVGTGSQTPSVSEDWNELQSASRQSFLDVAWLHGAPDSFASYYSSNLNRTKLRAPKKKEIVTFLIIVAMPEWWPIAKWQKSYVQWSMMNCIYCTRLRGYVSKHF